MDLKFILMFIKRTKISMEKYKSVLRLLRIPQWIKNLFIFLPVFFGLKFYEVDKLTNAFVAFFGFSFVASAVYIFNDLLDINEDKLHPIKRSRPLASGTIKIKEACILIFVLLVIGFSIFIFFIQSQLALYLVGIYLILNIFYTMKLKHVPILDISIISVGFLLRIFIGGDVTDTVLSHWIIIMTFLLALFLALAKRRDDVLVYLNTGQITRKNIDGYNLEFLNSAMTIMSSVIIVSYIMYAVSLSSKINNLTFTVIFVILGLLRYLQIAFVKKDSGDPTKVLIKDSFLQIVLVGWIFTLWILLYI